MTKRKQPAAKASAIPDPVLDAIAEHKALIKESGRLEANAALVRADAEKKYGEWDPRSGFLDWPGSTIIKRPCRQWYRASHAALVAGKRMARMNPSTLAGAAALLDHARRYYADEAHEDWAKIAFKTCAATLARMSAETSL